LIWVLVKAVLGFEYITDFIFMEDNVENAEAIKILRAKYSP